MGSLCLSKHSFLSLGCAMNNSNLQVPEAIAPEVFTRAARLYAQAVRGYSLEELI